MVQSGAGGFVYQTVSQDVDMKNEDVDMKNQVDGILFQLQRLLRPKQPRFMVSTHITSNLVRDYGSRPWCSGFDGNKLYLALRQLREVEPGFVDFQAAGRAVLASRCSKATGFCNRHVGWMLHRLRVTKVPRKRQSRRS